VVKLHFGDFDLFLGAGALTPAPTVTPTVKQAKSALGLLDHASNILLLGKAYFQAGFIPCDIPHPGVAHFRAYAEDPRSEVE
jgi:hypothetical protein